MEKPITSAADVVIMLVLILIVTLIVLSIGGSGKTEIVEVAEKGSISSKCGGWQSLAQCQKACYEDACETTYCNPKDPKDITTNTCKEYLEKMENRASVDVSPTEITGFTAGGTAQITIVVKDKNGNTLPASAQATGAGTGSVDDTTKPMSVKLSSIGIINIRITPTTPEIVGATVSVAVVK